MSDKLWKRTRKNGECVEYMGQRTVCEYCEKWEDRCQCDPVAKRKMRELTAAQQRIVALEARVTALKYVINNFETGGTIEDLNNAIQVMKIEDDLSALAAHDAKIAAEARREALEEAANEVDSLAERPFYNEPEFSAMMTAATAIRALKEKTNDKAD